ncbi:hypothetical protein ACIO87_37485 [Streptomyces sp. NPDC087218]|uniref:hypothetical protein n=1 Tax=Streptomyces sp. NPDC087218 TaxID=3365769 RepID=UPI0037F57C20
MERLFDFGCLVGFGADVCVELLLEVCVALLQSNAVSGGFEGQESDICISFRNSPEHGH